MSRRERETIMNKYSEYIDEIMHEEGFVSYNTWQMGFSKFKKLMTDKFPDWRYNKRDLREAGYYLNTTYWKVMESRR